MLFMALILASLFPIIPVIYGDTLETVLTIANVPPYILRADINVFVNTGDAAITLSENSTVQVQCNATLNDANGWQDISSLNGTLYNTHTATHGTANDNNFHYTNTSCNVFSGSGNIRAGVCEFTTFYYAQNSSAWQCNLTVYDAGVSGSSANSSNSTYGNFSVNALTALNIPATIMFGTMNPGDTSAINKTNVTNTGNTILDLSIYGYANNATDSPNAMNCTLGTNKNISLYFIRYNVTAGRLNNCASADFSWTANYWNLTNLTNAKNWTQFTLPPRTVDAAGGDAGNYTCWILKVPSAGESDIGGTCRGIISIAAFINE